MWKVVLWLHVILAWIAVEAYEDGQPYYEYLFSRRDGIAYVEPLLVPVHNDGQNSTVYIRNQHPRLLNTSIAHQDLYDLREPNYELQSSGQRFISHRRQREMKAIPDPQLELLHSMAGMEETRQCVLELQISMSCDHCVCMGGQFYICTSRKCDQNRDESTALRTAHQKQRYFQENPECIEGEAIKSFDECNRCYCGGGQVLCTRKKCSKQLEHQKQCTPGDRIPSPDNCNACACNSRGFIVCTVKSCGPDLSSGIRDMICTPNLWFSMTGAGRCKECYCVNGKTAFCFVKLCVDENKSQRLMLKNAIQSIPGILPSKCRKLDYMQDQCTRCYCNDALTWICRTTNSKKCNKKIPNLWGGGVNRNPTRRPHTRPPYRPPHHGGYDNNGNWPKRPGWQENTRRPPYDRPKYPNGNGKWKPTRPKHPERPIATTKSWANIANEWFNSIMSTKYTYESKSTHGDSKQIPDLTTKPFIYSSTTQEQPSRTPYQTSFQTPYQTSSQTPPLDFNPPSEEEEEPYIPEPSEIPLEITHSPKTTFMQTPEDVPPSVDGVDSNEGIFSLSEEEKTPSYTSPPPGFHSTVHFFEPTMSTVPSFGGSVYTNVARGPFCIAGKQISLGSKNNCQGCICTSTNEWKCWSVPGPCNTSSTCNSGKLKKNSKSRCSVCYCGSDQTSFCATDVSCANNIKPISTCDALSCMDSCSATPPGFGICRDNECVCIE